MPSSSPLFRLCGVCHILQAKPAGKSFQHEDWQSNTLALKVEEREEEKIYREKQAFRGNPNEKDRKRGMIGLDCERSRHPLARWWFIWFILSFVLLSGEWSMCALLVSYTLIMSRFISTMVGWRIKDRARCRTPSGPSIGSSNKPKRFIRAASYCSHWFKSIFLLSIRPCNWK